MDNPSLVAALVNRVAVMQIITIIYATYEFFGKNGFIDCLNFVRKCSRRQQNSWTDCLDPARQAIRSALPRSRIWLLVVYLASVQYYVKIKNAPSLTGILDDGRDTHTWHDRSPWLASLYALKVFLCLNTNIGTWYRALETLQSRRQIRPIKWWPYEHENDEGLWPRTSQAWRWLLVHHTKRGFQTAGVPLLSWITQQPSRPSWNQFANPERVLCALLQKAMEKSSVALCVGRLRYSCS